MRAVRFPEKMQKIAKIAKKCITFLPNRCTKYNSGAASDSVIPGKVGPANQKNIARLSTTGIIEKLYSAAYFRTGKSQPQESFGGQ